MERNELTNKFEYLLSDEAFVEKLSSAKTAAAVAAVFSAEGVQLTEEDAKQLMDYVVQDGELSEETLDSVAGGIVWESVYVACFAIGLGAGLAHGAYKRLKKAWG